MSLDREIGIGSGETVASVWGMLQELGDARGCPNGWIRVGRLSVTVVNGELSRRQFPEEFNFRAAILMDLVAPRGTDPKDLIKLLSAVASRTRADLIYVVNGDFAMAQRRDGVWRISSDLRTTLRPDELSSMFV